MTRDRALLLAGTALFVMAASWPIAVKTPTEQAGCGTYSNANTSCTISGADNNTNLLNLDAAINDPEVRAFGEMTGAAANVFPYFTSATQTAAAPITALGRTLVSGATTGAMQGTLALVPGTNVQPYSANLVETGAVDAGVTGLALLGTATEAAAQGVLSLVPGTNVQPFDADLSLYGAITPSTFMQSYLASADQAAAQTALGVTPYTVRVIAANMSCVPPASLNALPYVRPGGSSPAEQQVQAYIFDQTTNWYLDCGFRVPSDLPSSSGLKINACSMSPVNSGSFILRAGIRSYASNDADASETYTFVDSAATLISGTSGVPVCVTITMTNAEADAIAAGNYANLRLSRNAASASDTVAGNLEVIETSITIERN